MKKITLVMLLCLIAFVQAFAETRIYFAYSNSASQAALPTTVDDEPLTTIDYRIGNGFKVNNWNNFNGPWNPSSGGFVEGGIYGFRQYGISTSKTEFSAPHHIEPNNTINPVADLSIVNEDWTFHVAIATTYQGALTFTFCESNGSQHVTDISELVPNRNGSWNEVTIEMSDYIKETGMDFSNAVFSAAAEQGWERDMMIFAGNEVTEDCWFGWDDCYLTDNGSLPSMIGVVAAPQTENAYNLAGQRVNADYKGVVICDGRKYVK